MAVSTTAKIRIYKMQAQALYSAGGGTIVEPDGTWTPGDEDAVTWLIDEINVDTIIDMVKDALDEIPNLACDFLEYEMHYQEHQSLVLPHIMLYNVTYSGSSYINEATWATLANLIEAKLDALYKFNYDNVHLELLVVDDTTIS